MDSKLVVEQMSGRWKIKHPDMKPLAAEAEPAGAVRHDVHLGPARAEQARRPARQRGARRQARAASPSPATSLVEEPETEVEPVEAAPSMQTQTRGWSGPGGPPTTLVLVRHGVTPHTRREAVLRRPRQRQPRASATRAGPRSGPTPTGWRRSPSGSTRSSPRRCAARWSPPRSSPRRSGTTVEVEPGFAEMEFGVWDGLTFAEVGEQHPDELDAWLGSLDVAPEGGESFRVVQERVLAGLAAAARRRTPARPWWWSAT